jgi:hypothetical protein
MLSGLISPDRLVSLADTLAGEWIARAAPRTSPAHERALLHLCGVDGVDRDGRSLAAAVVDPYLAEFPERLADGILLPFAAALLEYGVAPRALALDIASGAVDLALEAQLVQDPDRLGLAEGQARDLVAASLERIDANRTATLELAGLFGESPRPWFGTTLQATDLEAARTEARLLLDAGSDVIRVAMSAGFDGPGGPVLSGSQVGLAELRRLLDEAGAERGRYVRLLVAGSSPQAPEVAVTAALERADIVELDMMSTIVGEGADPERVLVDHLFACALMARAGLTVSIGPGPLVVAPDLAAGRPSDAATRAGRAIALQLLSVAFARRSGLAAGQIVVGSLPPWLVAERHETAQAIAEVALRRALFPEHGLVFDEPSGQDGLDVWPFLVAAAIVGDDPAALVLRRTEPERLRYVAQSTRAALRVSQGVAAGLEPRALRGPALDHARDCARSAADVLERLAGEGWPVVTGIPATEVVSTTGHELVAVRRSALDPLGLRRAGSTG